MKDDERHAGAAKDRLDDLLANAPSVMTVSDVAELLRVRDQTVTAWLNDDPPILPGWKVGRKWFISREALKDTMREGSNIPMPSFDGEDGP